MATEYKLTKEEYEKVKHLLKKEAIKYNALDDLVGGIVFIRTVTHYFTGRAINITGDFIHLEDAAWIPDTGRFYEFVKGTPTDSLEVEPIGTTFVAIGSIIEIMPYSNLFTVQK
jgi:hypothetical protein